MNNKQKKEVDALIDLIIDFFLWEWKSGRLDDKDES